jgi:hypothetical protein
MCYAAGLENALHIRDCRAQAWSVYGAKRAQPVATDGKWLSSENGSNRPIPHPAATHGNALGPDGKEGVDGSSPSEGLQKCCMRRFSVQAEVEVVVWHRLRRAVSL